MAPGADADEPSSSSREVADSYTIVDGVKVSPIRSLKDFVSDKSNYEAPPIRNLDRWNNRIVSNLLYYQTNYFALLFSFLAFYSCYFGQEFAVGMLAILLIIGSAVFTVSSNARFQGLRREYPLVTLGSIIVSFYFFMCFLSSVFVVNKFFERLGIRETLMGKLLDALGVTVKI